MRELLQQAVEALKALADEFVKVYPIYYYAEPWAHNRNEVLKNARATIAIVEASPPALQQQEEKGEPTPSVSEKDVESMMRMARRFKSGITAENELRAYFMVFTEAASPSTPVQQEAGDGNGAAGNEKDERPVDGGRSASLRGESSVLSCSPNGAAAPDTNETAGVMASDEAQP